MRVVSGFRGEQIEGKEFNTRLFTTMAQNPRPRVPLYRQTLWIDVNF